MAGQQSNEKVVATASSAKAGTATAGSKTGRRNGHSAAKGNGSASDPPHVCGICNKCFDRSKLFKFGRELGFRSLRTVYLNSWSFYHLADLTYRLIGDLRDRHKRRCARSSQKVKVSKRKSCLACAQSKLGCDLDTPSCSRCVGRGTNCEYAVPPPSALSSVIPRPSSFPAHSPTSRYDHRTGHDFLSYGKHSNSLPYHVSHNNAGDMSSIPIIHSPVSGYPTPPFHDNFLMPLNDSYIGNQPFDLFSSLTSQPFLPNDPRTPTSAGGHSTGFEVSELDSFHGHDIPPTFSDWYHDSSVGSDLQMQQGQIHGPWHPYSNDKHPIEINHIPFHHRSPVENPSSFSLFNVLGLPGNDPSLSPPHSVGFLEVSPTFFPSPEMPFELSSSGTDDTFNHSPIGSDISDLNSDSWRRDSYYPRHESIPEPLHDPSTGFFDIQSLTSLAATTNSKAALNTLFSSLDLIKLVRSYPTMMLQESFYPPFVHHTLYRSADGRIAGPLANALYCVGAYNDMVPSTKRLVHDMINSERESLIRDFRSWSSPNINSLGALHAMCVYQITGLLDMQDPIQVRNAELHHPFLLKLAKRLCSEKLDAGSVKAKESDWNAWRMAETLRRTIFLVNIINTLSRHNHPAQNLSPYDDLDEEQIFNMPLPAPDPMWKASTAGEWELAKSMLGWEHGQQRTIRMVLSRLAEGYSDTENRIWFEDFQPLSLLIIACVRLHM